MWQNKAYQCNVFCEMPLKSDQKKRADRNRTLIINEHEHEVLEKKLLVVGAINLRKKEILNKVILGDIYDVLDKLPDNFADLIVLDPPYNLTKNFHGFHFNSSSDDDYLVYLRSWFPKVISKLKPTGSVYLCGDWKCTSMLQKVMSEHLTVLNRITWQREKGRGASKNWKNGMEDIWYGVMNPKDYYFDVTAVKIKRRVKAPYKENGVPKDWQETSEGKFRITYPSNFWDDISVPYWSMPENTDHPTQKPEKLIAKLILASCPLDGVVFDPFLGSGTTAVTAKKLGRKFVGIEMNEEYAIWAEKRIQMAERNRSIQGFEEGVFWERNSGK